MTTKQFHLGDLLTITTGRLLSPSGMSGLYAILRHITGEPIYTHQIPRVLAEAKPYVLEAFPVLAGIDLSGVDEDTYEAWMALQVQQYGEFFEVWPMPPGMHYSIDPVSELAEIIHPSKIIVVKDECAPHDPDESES